MMLLALPACLPACLASPALWRARVWKGRRGIRGVARKAKKGWVSSRD